MPGYHADFQPDFREEDDEEGAVHEKPIELKASESPAPPPNPTEPVTTTWFGERAIIQVGDSADCEDGGIIRL